MKLHLPKSLRSALLATFAVVACSSSAWAGTWGNNGPTGTENSVYYVSATETKVDTTAGNQANITELYLAQAVDGDGATGSKAATIAELVLKDGDTLTVETHPWKEGNVNFSLLTIKEMTIGDGSGSASFNIDANQGVQINSIDGSISSLTNAGKLTLGSVTIDGDVTNSGTLNLMGTLRGQGNIVGDGIVGVDTSGKMTAFDGSFSYSYADGSVVSTFSGFIRGEQTFRVLGDGVSYEGAVYVNGSDTAVALAEGGYITADVGSSNVFYVNDTWNYNADQSSGATSFEVGKNSTLNFAGGDLPSDGLIINSDGAVTMSAQTSMPDAVTINGGTFNNKGYKISGGKLVLNGLSSATISGNCALSGSIDLVNTYLTLGNDDTTDWGNGVMTIKIGAGATLDVQKYRQSIKNGSVIEMAGGTLTGTGGSNGNYVYGIDYFNGGRFNTSADSLIATNVGGHDGGNVEFDVNTGKTLTMTGNLVGVGTFSKTNDGTMVYKGAAFTRDLTIGGGVFEYYVNRDAQNNVETRNHNGTISGTATLRKSGEGTLNLSSDKVSVTKFDVTGGTLGYNLVSGEKEITLTGTGGTFAKKGVGTVDLGALASYNYNGTLKVTDGKVVFAGSDEEDSTFVKLVKNLTTEGEGCVEIEGNIKFNYSGSDVVISSDDNLHITGNLVINSWASDNAPDGDGMRRWNVNHGGNIAVDGHLWLTNKQKMVINGGHVSALNGVRLGHSENSTQGSYKSKFVLEDGSLSTSSFTFYAGGSEIIMSGGELIFTPATDGEVVLKNSYTGDNPGINKFTVTGGVLKATDSSWALTGSSTNIVSLGNVTFDIASGKTVTLSGNIALTGSVESYGKGELQLGNTTFSIAEQDLNSFTVCRGELADSSQVNGLGGRVYSVLWGTGSIAQLDGTNLSVLIDGAAAGDRWNADTFEITSSATNDFIINTQFATSEATAANGAVGADSFIVNKGGTFTVAGDITDGKTAKELVMETLGSGTMSLTTAVSLSNDGESTMFHGNLDVESGVTLTLGRTGSNAVECDVNVSSLSALNLNGGTLKMYYVAPHIKSMTVIEGANNSKIDIDDTWGKKISYKADAARIDTLQLESDLTIQTNWKSNFSIGVLTGDGDLTAKQSNGYESIVSKLWIDGVDNYTGNISLSGKMALMLNIGENESLNASQLTVSGELAGATLTGSGKYNLGSATSLASRVSLGDAWTGTVAITNASANGTSLASLGNASSKISINGMSGWIQRENVASHVVLGANGLTLTAYSTDGSYNFSGGISGAGDFILDSSSAADPHFSIGSNGTSEWKGGFIVKNMAADKTVELKMVGGGELMAADSKGVQMNSNNGTLSLIIGNADVSTTMNGAVSKSKNANGSLNMTVQGDTVFNGAVTTDKVNVLEGAEATFNQEIITSEIDIAAGGEVVIANDWWRVSASSTDESASSTNEPAGLLKGAGNLTLKASADATAENLTTTKFHVGDYSGVLDIQNSALVYSHIIVDEGKSLKLDGSDNNGEAYIEVDLYNGSSVTTDITVDGTEIGIDKLTVLGEAVFGTDASLDPSNKGLAGVFDIGFLHSAYDDAVYDNMIFRSNTNTSDITVFNLDNLNYAGRITLQSTNTEDYRYAALNIGSDDPEMEEIAGYWYGTSDIELLTGASETDQVVLGIVGDVLVQSFLGADTDAYIVAGRVTETLAEGETFKSTTDEYVNVTFKGLDETSPAVSSATIMSNLNLYKVNSGSQTFNGDTTSFNGLVDVSGGTLGFGTSSLKTTVTTVHDGKLQYADGEVTMTRLGENGEVSAEITEASFSKAEDGTVCIDGGTMKNTLLSIKEATSLELGKVHMYDNSQVAGSADSRNEVTLNHTTLVMENLGKGTLETLQPDTMSAEGMMELGLIVGAEGISYTTDMFKDVNLTGLGYVEIGTLLADALLQHDYVALEFNQAYLDQSLQLITGVDIDPRLEGVFITTYIDTEAGRLYMSVPEPSTATLSLLALAALAARRRRK